MRVCCWACHLTQQRCLLHITTCSFPLFFWGGELPEMLDEGLWVCEQELACATLLAAVMTVGKITALCDWAHIRTASAV